MADGYVYKISSRYLQKWLSCYIKHVKTVIFHVISGFSCDIPNFIFLTDFDASKSVKGSFSRSLRQSDPKTYIAALNPEMFWFDLFYLVT